MNTLELRHIRKSFDGQGVLEDISLSVPAGSVTAIIGPSGSGKSTLLRCATLLETADGGDIIYEGKYAAKDGVYAPKAELHAIRRYFGLVFQSYNLWPHMTVYDNMEFGLKLRKVPRAERRERIAQMLELIKMPGTEKKYPGQMSGGQQQRIAIARSLLLRPEVLLLDEPFSALDYQTRLTVSADIAAMIRKAEKSVILITHDLAEAISLADRVLILSARPARVKAEFPIHLTAADHSPLAARRAPEYGQLFNQIWEELSNENN